MSLVAKHVMPKEKDLGDNFVVRRSLPDFDYRSVGPFVFWDHMGPAKIGNGVEMKVRAHPHIGLATITFLYSGQILHRDSLNNEQFIKPGEVNWMTAGKGIVHSERSFCEEGTFELEGIQLWLGLPKESEEVDPSFFHCKHNDLPSFHEAGVETTLIAGSWKDQKSPVPVYSDLFYLHTEFTKEGVFQHKFDPKHQAAIYVGRGEVEIEGKRYPRYSMIFLEQGADLKLKADSGSNIMTFGGEAFPEKRHMWWNFVSSSKERIEEAKKQWTEQKFDPVVNETEFIPLPSR